MVFALQTWLIASWVEWQFGASFGHRGFTDGFALAAPFIASTFAWAASHRKAMPLFAAGTAAAVLLSVAQMIQYWIGVLPDGRHDVGAIPGSVPAIPMTRANWFRAAAALLVAVGLLGYLYDPPWMGGVTSGLRGWEQDPPGTFFRWTTGRATFFVPSNTSDDDGAAARGVPRARTARR